MSVLERGRSASRRPAALAAVLLLAGCGAVPPQTSPPAGSPPPGSLAATAARSPDATPSPTPSPAWRGRVVLRYGDGAFGFADANGITDLSVPAGAWWLGTGSAGSAILLLPASAGTVDAIVGRVSDGALDIERRVGTGDAPAGAGCLSASGSIALADSATLQLALVDGERRQPIELAGHGTVGECAWLSDDALVAPAEHDHTLLYFHRVAEGHDAAGHAGAFGDVAGRYPWAVSGRLALTTGDAEDEAISVWNVGRIVGDGSSPPALSPLSALRPGDGPRRGVHALSADGRWLVSGGEDDGAPRLFVYALGDEQAESVATLDLEKPVDDLVVLDAGE